MDNNLKEEMFYKSFLELMSKNDGGSFIDSFITRNTEIRDTNTSEGYRLGMISALLKLKEEIRNV